MLAIVAVNCPYKSPHSWLWLVVMVVVLLVGLSLSQLWGVFMPRTDGARTHSILYFKDIAATSVTDYHRRIGTITEAELLDDLACQIHRNAEILTDKFERVQLAMKFSGVALFPWLTFLIGLAAGGTALKIGGG